MIDATPFVLQAAVGHSTVVATGAGVVNMAHEILYTLLTVSGIYFLGSGVARGMREHWKRGTGAAASALGGGIVLAVVVAHIVGIYQRGNQEFEQLPGGVGKPGISVNRGW